MSSIATAPSRTTDKDGQNNGKQLHVLASPESTPSLEQARVEYPASALPVDEVQRVERLLTQLEARSLALVPYGYGNIPPAPATRPGNGLLAAVLVGIWLSTLVLAVVYFKYVYHPQQTVERVAAPLVIPSAADPQEQKVASSVDHLAKALVSSSQKLDEIQVAMERSNRDLQKMAARVNVEHSKPVPVSKPAKSQPNESAAPATPTDTSLPKDWHRVLEIKPTNAATAHKSAEGSIDYWLVARGANKVKVLPIGTSPDGVVVHNLEDGKDYTLTPAGEWRNGSMITSEN